MVHNPGRIQEWFGDCLAYITPGAKDRENGLVDLVCFVYLVDLVHLVSSVQQKTPTDQMN